MSLLYSFFFAAGIAAFTYSKMGKRVGYGNTANVYTLVAVAFVLSLIVFYTLAKTAFHLN